MQHNPLRGRRYRNWGRRRRPNGDFRLLIGFFVFGVLIIVAGIVAALNPAWPIVQKYGQQPGGIILIGVIVAGISLYAILSTRRGGNP